MSGTIETQMTDNETPETMDDWTLLRDIIWPKRAESVPRKTSTPN